MNDLVAYLRIHHLNRWASEAQHLIDRTSDYDALQKRVTEAEAANELDRTRVAKALTELNGAIMSRSWVLEGRGPYEWDDDDYRAEFSLWMRDVEEAMKLFARIACDWHGCPMDWTEIRHARAILADRRTVLEGSDTTEKASDNA